MFVLVCKDVVLWRSSTSLLVVTFVLFMAFFHESTARATTVRNDDDGHRIKKACRAPICG